MENKPELLRPTEAGKMLQIGRSKLYELISSGDIPTVEIGGMLRVPRRWVTYRVSRALAAHAAQHGDAE